MFKSFIVQEIPHFFQLPKEQQEDIIYQNKEKLIPSFYKYFLNEISLDNNLKNNLELQLLLKNNNEEEISDFFHKIPTYYSNIYNENLLFFEGVGENLFYLNEFIDIKEEKIESISQYAEYLYQGKLKYNQNVKKNLDGDWIRLIWYTNNESKFYYGNLYSIESYLFYILEDTYSKYLNIFFDVTYSRNLIKKYNYYKKDLQIKFFKDKIEEYISNFQNNFSIASLENTIFIIHKNSKIENNMEIIFNDITSFENIRFETFQKDLEKKINYNINELEIIKKNEISKLKMYMNSIYEKSLRLI